MHLTSNILGLEYFWKTNSLQKQTGACLCKYVGGLWSVIGSYCMVTQVFALLTITQFIVLDIKKTSFLNKSIVTPPQYMKLCNLLALKFIV